MNTFKKFAASLAAFTAAASLGVGSLSVSAANLTEVNTDLLADQATAEEEFVASFDNPQRGQSRKSLSRQRCFLN
ncbi:MAG: hypothetical protein ACI4JB_09970 [Porcipelethomonas sp.]